MAKEKKQDEALENVQESLSTAGAWIVKYQNHLMSVLLGIVVIIVAVMAINQYVVKPKQQEALNEVGKAVQYFAANDFESALNGDENTLGFAAIADEYHNQGGKLAACYAGICAYNLGMYEDAVAYLEKFDADDEVIAPAAKMKLGDAYVALDNVEKAVKCFEKAAKQGNKVIAPIALKKAGIAYLHLGENAKAVKAFEQIKANYPASQEAQDIDKYIANAE